MINVAKYKTIAGAAKGLAKALVKLGYDGAVALTPAVAEDYGYGKGWAVVCESVPYEGMILLSMGESMYCEPWVGPYDSKPEINLMGNDNWFAEPYNSYVMCFGT